MSKQQHSTAESETIDGIIRSRSTSKLMLAPAKLADIDIPWTASHAAELRTMIEGAVWAPFHKRSHEATHRSGTLDSIVPWRFHVLERKSCLALLHHMEVQAGAQPDSIWSRAWSSKIPNMLAACGALVQVYWLPDPIDNAPSGHESYAAGNEPPMTMNNIEHVAAAGAAVQNLLLAAQARGWRSYWSSGGVLRDDEVARWLGIDAAQAPLASVFLSPQLTDGVVAAEGGLRDQRGSLGSWARWVTLP